MEKLELINGEDLLKKKFPNPKTHPKLLYPFAGVVIDSPVALQRDDDLDRYNVTVSCCPFCGKQHHHVVCAPIGKTIKRGHNFGHRVEHCLTQDVKCAAEFVHGYVLLNLSTYKRPK